MQINSLIADIYQLLEKKDGWFTSEISARLSADIAARLSTQLNRPKEPPCLRLSAMGSRCPRALWFSIHNPELAESLPAWATFKYSFGHVIEALAITLARCSGHEVTGEQDVVTVDGIQGHRDCVIDGCIVDVKSASSIGFKKFKEKTLEKDDPFGYLDQLDGYMVGSSNDSLVRIKDRAYLFAIDKQLGHMCLYEHRLREQSIRRRIAEYKEIIGRDSPPLCTCGTVPEGKSGNVRLDTKASYSPFRHACFPKLRTFLYASGPVYLTEVKRKPEVTEIDSKGNIVYN